MPHVPPKAYSPFALVVAPAGFDESGICPNVEFHGHGVVFEPPGQLILRGEYLCHVSVPGQSQGSVLLTGQFGGKLKYGI